MGATKSGPATPHQPTEETRAQISALVSFGNTQEQIAQYIGISVDTLQRHYRHELDTALLDANARVANKLFRKATEGDDLSAMVFWLKTRGKWREKDDQQATPMEKMFAMVIDKLKE